MMLFKSRKYRFFKHKIDAVQEAIWEQDFKVSKSKQIREGIREDRERAIEAVQKVTAAIHAEKDKSEKSALEKEKEAFTDNVKRYEGQMKMIDEQINGVPAKGEDPGIEGIKDRIKALAELREMYKQYIASL